MATKVISHEEGSFLTDVKEIRRRTRQQIMEGAVTADYRGDRETVVRFSTRRSLPKLCVCSATSATTTWRKASTLKRLPRSFLNTPRRNRDTPIK